MSSFESGGNGSRVKVNGVLFETLMPVRTIQVPQPEEQVPVQIGVRITNQSSTPYRFNLPGFTPQLFDSNGQEVKSGTNSNARRLTEEADVPLLDLGEQITYYTVLDLLWSAENRFWMRGTFPYGGFWSASRLEIGSYRLRFRYGVRLPQYSLLFHYGRAEIKNFWVGEVHTPLVEFQLSES